MRAPRCWYRKQTEAAPISGKPGIRVDHSNLTGEEAEMDSKAKQPTDKDILKELEKDTDAGAIQEEINEKENERRKRDRNASSEE